MKALVKYLAALLLCLVLCPGLLRPERRCPHLYFDQCLQSVEGEENNLRKHPPYGKRIRGGHTGIQGDAVRSADEGDVEIQSGEGV